MFQYKFLHFNITLHLFYKHVQCIYCLRLVILCVPCVATVASCLLAAALLPNKKSPRIQPVSRKS